MGRLELLLPLCHYVTLVQPDGNARLRHGALTGAAEKRANLAASST